MTVLGTPHKPRKKRREASQPATSGNEIALSDSKAAAQSPAFPLVAFLWPARKHTSQWVTLPLVLMIVGLFRWCMGLWGYSDPPMHGDYEAQRHWMEITRHLPISQWYFYDLDYWGLDYPPLTAYHSWLVGKIGSLINPSWFALDSSRGIEQPLLKVYMRATVIVSEYITYIPATIILSRRLARLRGVSKWESSIALVAILMQPATILIDHGHFQYNTVMLGLVLASLSCMLSDHPIWACTFFVAALCYKQMALYFAPAIFAYLLGVCLLPTLHVGRAWCSLRYTQWDIPTPFHQQSPGQPLFALILPYIDERSMLYTLLLQLSQTVHRIFPFARGLFEDKVANMWCAIHTIHKLHTYPIPLLQRVSLFATMMSILPACMIISLFPRKDLLLWALASSAWGFFLCSFQVHEKSNLLPLLPMTILFAGDGGLGVEMRAWIGLANMLGAWTLFPLLTRDELRVPYYVLSLLWAYLMGLPPTNLDLYIGKQAIKSGMRLSTQSLHLTIYTAMAVWHLLEAFVETPKGKPDLWLVINVLIGFAGFGICYLWCTWQLILRSGVMDQWLAFRAQMDAKVKGKRDEKEQFLPPGKGTRATPPREAKSGKGQKKS